MLFRSGLCFLIEIIFKYSDFFDDDDVSKLICRVLKQVFYRKEITVNLNKPEAPDYLANLLRSFEKIHDLLIKKPKDYEKFYKASLIKAYYTFPSIRSEFLTLCDSQAKGNFCPNDTKKYKINEHVDEQIKALFIKSDQFGLKIKKNDLLDKLRVNPELLMGVISGWIKYTKKLLCDIKIPWEKIEGYTYMKNLLLSKLKNDDVTNFTLTFKTAIKRFLLITDSLNEMMKTTFSVCYAFDVKKVDGTVDLMLSWVKGMVEQGMKPFNPEFDFDFFRKSVNIMLQMHKLYTSYKCLWMLYLVFQYIPSYCSYNIR